MAEKKKKSIYSRRLKDVNKDGKRNFKDTFLGDLIGADGKLGVQGDDMRSSLKGSRRESDSDTKKRSTKRKTNVDTTDDARSKRTRSAKSTTRSTVDKTDDARSKRTNASSKSKALEKGPSSRKGPRGKGGTATELTYNGVTFDEYKSIDSNNALKRYAFDLPSGMTRAEFNRKAREQRNEKESKARLDTTDDARARRKRVNDLPGKVGPNIPGVAKGGMMKKRGYKAGGVTKANCGASMKPNRMARK